MTRDNWFFAVTVAWCIFVLGVMNFVLYVH